MASRGAAAISSHVARIASPPRASTRRVMPPPPPRAAAAATTTPTFAPVVLRGDEILRCVLTNFFHPPLGFNI
jgi:hypothetical protein|tara:strand:- start:2104 stop:2322 length:219 start_codon:yes stop_codon:yes gene_type:complete